MWKSILVGVLVAVVILGAAAAGYAFGVGRADAGGAEVVRAYFPGGTLTRQGMMGGPGGMMGGQFEVQGQRGFMMGGRNYRVEGQYGMMGGPGGMMGGQGTGPLHDYILAGYADAFGITVEDLQARLQAGETLYEIAVASGLTDEQFAALHAQVRTDALAKAVEDGVITQAQADWMAQHMQSGGMMGGGFGIGAGECPMGGTGGTSSGGSKP